jgi:hypothetical protein
MEQRRQRRDYVMNCPVCDGRSIGKVGVEQFFCWDCCIEFSNQVDKVVIYNLGEDGTLVAWDDTLRNMEQTA